MRGGAHAPLPFSPANPTTMEIPEDSPQHQERYLQAKAERLEGDLNDLDKRSTKEGYIDTDEALDMLGRCRLFVRETRKYLDSD